LPYDSWIRAHVLAGTRIVKVAPYSMVVSGTIAVVGQLTSPELRLREVRGPTSWAQERTERLFERCSAWICLSLPVEPRRPIALLFER
jgi:hypothetical protein